ncbi:hypothetical protein PHYSODRAFT_522299, partial [Phytophthora sojae]
EAATPWTCPQPTWACWEKFHRYYSEKKLFSPKGNINRGSVRAKLRQEATAKMTTSNLPEASTAQLI